MRFPAAATVVIRNATVPTAVMAASADDRQPLQRLDILVRDGTIEALHPALTRPQVAAAEFDIDGGLVLPAFVDIHTHLDKGHIWPRQPNPHGTFMGALLAVAEDRMSRWTASDVRRRMDFALRCAFAHGTAAIRTHVDSAPPQDGISWEVVEAVREEWKGRIELQAVALVGPDEMVDRELMRRLAARVKAAAGVLGGAIAEHPRSKQAMLNLVEVAGEYGLDLDVHCDESLDPAATSLRHLADAVVETGFRGKVLAGHCCSIAVQDERTQRETISRVAAAGIAIVSLPLCNLYLQDRDPNGECTPLRRGVTLVKEFKAAGIPVAVASDNTRDPFYAYGDLDPVEVLREAARILQFDHPQAKAWDWVRSLGAGAATIGGFDHRAEVAVGTPADLVLFRARDWTELLSRPQSDRIVLRQGRAVDRTLPDYRELDELME